MMTQPFAVVLLFLAMFVQVAMTVYVIVRTGRVRVAHVRARRVKISDVALGQNAWPEDATKLANNYRNQFEMPVLFYIASVLAMSLKLADLILALLAIAFVASRVVHMIVHTGSNKIRLRFNSFAVGVTLVSLMWSWLLFKFLLGA